MKADKIYLGNVITMDEKKPYAEAVAVKDGNIMYVGSEKTARTLCDGNAEVIDLGGNSIYPGFMEAHCHPMGAGKLLDKETYCDLSAGETMEDYLKSISDFVAKYPEREEYHGSGFVEGNVKPEASMLDAICLDRPVLMQTNDGTPTGYISENPAFDVRAKIKTSIEDGVSALLVAQEFFFSMGYTAIYDAGMELLEKTAVDIYAATVATGKYKLRTYAGSVIDEFCEDIDGAVENIAKMQKKHNSEYFKVIGVKTFSDGVVEGHTALLLEDYNDQPGYKGVARMIDHDKLVQLYTSAALHNMSVHVHTIGDGAVRCNLDAMEEAVVAPLWTPKYPEIFLTVEKETGYIGEERLENEYPIKSFIDAGAVIAFHTDYPISKNVNIPNSIHTVVLRRNLGTDPSCARKADEFITRYRALLGLTKNVAYMWREENRLGSLETGKIANMSVYDSDFLNDALEKVGNSKLVCTIVDGEIVYKAK